MQMILHHNSPIIFLSAHCHLLPSYTMQLQSCSVMVISLTTTNHSYTPALFFSWLNTTHRYPTCRSKQLSLSPTVSTTWQVVQLSNTTWSPAQQSPGGTAPSFWRPQVFPDSLTQQAQSPLLFTAFFTFSFANSCLLTSRRYSLQIGCATATKVPGTAVVFLT